MRRLGLNDDVHRDTAAAFGADSIVRGSVLPYPGRNLIAGSPDGLPVSALAATADARLSPDAAVLVRGAARILPLGWGGERIDEAAALQEDIAAFASEVQAAGTYWAGPWRVLDLDGASADDAGTYVRALRAAGATRVDCWVYSKANGIALVWTGTEPDGPTASLALHVVPLGWISTNPTRELSDGVDVRWHWDEVVSLYEGLVA